MTSVHQPIRHTRGVLLAIFVAGLLGACGGGGEPPAAAQAATIELHQTSLLLTGPQQVRKLTAQARDAGGQAVDAKVTWTSSAPDQVSVDAEGNLRSVSPVGSAMLFAEADGVRSLPVFVATVELRPGTLLVRDIDVVRIGAPLTPAAGDFPGLGVQYDVWLSGIAAPAAGTLLLATETAAVAGRVVESAVEPGQVRVRLEMIGPSELVARYDVNWSVDLTAYPLVLDGVPSGYGVDAGPLQSRPRALADTAVVPGWKIPKTGTSPLECDATIKAVVQTKPIEAKVSGSPKLEIVSSRLDATEPPGHLRVALVGPFLVEVKVGLTAEAGLNADGKCELKGRIPMPILPFPIGPLVQLAIPVGVGVSVGGTIEVASIDASIEGKTGATFELGIECGPVPLGCRSLDKAEFINENTPHLELHDAQSDGFKVDLKAMVYFLTGVDVVFITKPFNVIDTKIGPKQSASFATVKRQADQADYASNYDLKFKLEIAPGSDLKKAVEHLIGGDDRGGITFSLGAQADISESPKGSWAADKTSNVVPGRDQVNFTVHLLPQSLPYLGLGYNVKSVEVYRKAEGELEYRHQTSIVARDGQSKFQWQWTPTTADAGKNKFAAFVKTQLPVLELEIHANSIIEVDVGCIGATPLAAGRVGVLDGGVCKESWAGTATGTLTDLIQYRALLSWEPDPSAPPVPGVSNLKAKGSVKVDFLQYTALGCTVTPDTLNDFGDASRLFIHRDVDPPAYSFNVKIDAEITIQCPNAAPLTFPTTVVNFNGAGTLTKQGTFIGGSTTTPQGSSSYQFELTVPQQ